MRTSSSSFYINSGNGFILSPAGQQYFTICGIYLSCEDGAQCEHPRRSSEGFSSIFAHTLYKALPTHLPHPHIAKYSVVDQTPDWGGAREVVASGFLGVPPSSKTTLWLTAGPNCFAKTWFGEKAHMFLFHVGITWWERGNHGILRRAMSRCASSFENGGWVGSCHV